MRADELLDGDLIFVRDGSVFSEAVIGSTDSYSHVGIHFGGMVYHADRRRGVVRDPLGKFLSVDGLEAFAYRHEGIDAEEARRNAVRLLGRPYNHSFRPGARSFYCSQYIAAVLPIFGEVPMKFGDGKGEISDFWREYFRSLGEEVPLDEPGTNPSQLSRSELLKFVGKIESV